MEEVARVGDVVLEKVDHCGEKNGKRGLKRRSTLLSFFFSSLTLHQHPPEALKVVLLLLVALVALIVGFDGGKVPLLLARHLRQVHQLRRTPQQLDVVPGQPVQLPVPRQPVVGYFHCPLQKERLSGEGVRREERPQVGEPAAVDVVAGEPVPGGGELLLQAHDVQRGKRLEERFAVSGQAGGASALLLIAGRGQVKGVLILEALRHRQQQVVAPGVILVGGKGGSGHVADEGRSLGGGLQEVKDV